MVQADHLVSDLSKLQTTQWGSINKNTKLWSPNTTHDPL